jgi:hypothetical protein
MDPKPCLQQKKSVMNSILTEVVKDFFPTKVVVFRSTAIVSFFNPLD